jgi:hypothetical protein
MSTMNYRWMEITFAEGRKLKFKFPVQATDETVIQRIEEVLKLPSVTISADEKLYVIPTNAIQMITVSPAPKKLPRTVIRGATLES